MNNILIVRLDRIGDVVLSTPVFKAVRDAYPESHIAVMVRPYSREIVEGNPYINEVIVYDKKGPENSFAGNIKFIMGLRKKKFDAAIILHPTARTHLIAFLAGIPERIGYDKKMGFLLTRRIPHTKQFGLRHEIDYTLGLLRYIGIKPERHPLYMPVRKESEERIKDLFSRAGISDEDTVVAINPSASCPSKRWSAERFAKLSDVLADRYNAKIIILSDRSDKVFGDRTASFMAKPSLNLSGRTTVGELAGVLKRSKLFISNDSGPVHIACALGVPVVAIFGRSDRGLSPQRWGPSGEKDIVIHKNVGCEVCLAHNCNIGFRCLEAVSVEDVLQAAEKILGG